MTAILDPRAAWLKERRAMVTASDAAAILGADPRRGPLAVYAEKVGEIEVDETRWMRWGRRVEGAIAEGYTDETGRQTFDLGAQEIQRHPDLPWLGATLDRMTAGSEANPAPVAVATPGDVTGPLECKAVAGHKAAEWREEPPLGYQIQLQIQMACTAAQWGSLCALIGGLTIAWKDLLRHDVFLAAALPRLEEFHLRVQRREPPEADALPGTTSAIRRLWSDEDGTTVALDQEALDLIDERDAIDAQTREAQARAQGIENQLRARLGNATFGALPDGTFLTLKTTKRDGYTVAPTSYRALRRWRPRTRRR